MLTAESEKPVHVTDAAVTTRGRLVRPLLIVTDWLYSNWRIIALYSLLFAILVFGALRSYLSSDGFLIYRDWVWPISFSHTTQIVNIYDPGLWSNAGPDPEGFTRSATSWPIAWLQFAGWSPGSVEKVFVVYFYAVDFALTFAAATLFVRWAAQGSSVVGRELLRVAFIVVSFVNPAALQWQAGLYYTAMWSVPILEIICFAALLSPRLISYRLPILAGLLLGIGATLDPRIWFWGFVVAVVLFFAVALRQAHYWPVIRKGVTLVLCSAPGLGMTLFSYYWSGLLETPVRANSVTTLTMVSSNAGPANILQLLGYWWSLMTYAPPGTSILSPQQGFLPTAGSPAYMVIPSGAITGLWLLALALVPILAVIGLLNRKTRSFAIPFTGIALLGIAFAIGTNPPMNFVATSTVSAGKIPVIGPGLQTVFAGPWYAQTVTESAYVVLILLSMIALEDLGTRFGVRAARREGITVVQFYLRKQGGNHRSKRRSIILPVLVLLVVVFSSWQFFTGSFYPAGYTPGVSANGIPGVGALDPTNPPAADVSTYDLLSGNTSAFNVYWPGPATSNSQNPFGPGLAGYSYPWTSRSSPSISMNSPKPFANPIGLAYLISNNITGSASSLLSMYGIKFAVIDNMSSEALLRNFGVSSIHQVLSFFESSPGLELVTNDTPDSWVFENEGPAGTVYPAQIATSYTGPPQVLSVINGALSSLNITAAYLGTGAQVPSLPITLGLTPRTSNRSISILTASNISQIVVKPQVTGFNGALSASVSEYVPGGLTRNLLSPYSDWAVSTWSGPTRGSVNVSVLSGRVIQFDHNDSGALVSLEYLSPLVANQSGGISANPEGLVVASGSIQYRVLNGSVASVWLDFVSSNSSLQPIAEQTSPRGPANGLWQTLNYSVQLPARTAVFTLRAMLNVTGRLQLRNTSIGWIESERAPQAFNGYALSLTNRSVAIPLNGTPEEADLEVLANGSTFVTTADSPRPISERIVTSGFQWVMIRNVTLSESTTLRLNGTSYLAGIAVLPTGYVGKLPDVDLAIRDHTVSLYDLDVSSPLGFYIVAALPFSPSWIVTGTEASVSSAEAGGDPGYIVFQAGATNSEMTLEFRDAGALPYIVVLFVAFNLGFCAVIAFRTVKTRQRRPVPTMSPPRTDEATSPESESAHLELRA